MYTIVHEPQKCKSCQGCAILMPNNFKMVDKKSVCYNTNVKNRQRIEELAHVCCGNCIQFKDETTGEISHIKGHTRVW
ncbi:MAG: hypothetical protein ACMXYC_03580 [Candidatus Woesearchaeota archaeon]